MIELNQINKIYKTSSGELHALKDVNLHINASEIFGVIGKSGAGKSSLIRCMNLLERPNSGTVKIDKQDITKLNTTDLRKVRHQIGMIFQQFNLLQRKTVWDNVALPLYLQNKDNNHIKQRLSELLDFVGLSDKKNNYPHQLSGGQQQRVAIARALATKPKVLLCDEATSSLDPQTTASILDLLLSINKEFNLTICLITHEMSVIKTICDRVAVIHDGTIMEVNSPLNLLLRPESQTAKDFLKSTIDSHIPATLKQHLVQEHTNDNIPLVHLSFIGSTASDPIMSNLALEENIKVNILQADIEYVKNVSVGNMLVELPNDEQKFNTALQYFNSHHIKTEVLGYVPHHLLQTT